MLFSRISVVVLAGCLLAAPVTGQETPAPEAKPAKEKKICRRIVGTGTILARSFCLTKSEWAAFHDRNARDADDALAKQFRNTKAIDRSEF
jgi:hypothetical protein